MNLQRAARRSVLVTMGVAVLAAILALIFGFSGNLAAMTYLTVIALVAMAGGAFFAFRNAAANGRRV